MLLMQCESKFSCANVNHDGLSVLVQVSGILHLGEKLKTSTNQVRYYYYPGPIGVRCLATGRAAVARGEILGHLLFLACVQ